MRWYSKQKWIVCGVTAIYFILMFLVWYTNQEAIVVWSVLIGGFSLTPLIFKFFKATPQYDKDKLNHSIYLVKEVIEKPMVSANIVYKEDKIQQTNLKWSETNPCFDFAIEHLNNKKYKKTLYEYYNSKKYSDLLIRKIINKIEKYREMVKYDLYGEHLIYFGEVDGQIAEWDKCINYIIYYEVIKNYQKGTSGKKLSLYQVNRKKPNDVYYLRWWDVYPEGGMVNGRYIIKGEVTILDDLKNKIEQLISNKNTIYTILDIDFLISRLKDNPYIETFETGRKKIIEQIKTEPLSGSCKKCP